METSDYFRKAVQEYLSGKEWGAQTHLATSSGIDVKHLNDFLAGRRTMKESFRIKITNFLEYDYLEILQHGKRLLEGKPEPANEPNTIVVQTHSTEKSNLLEEKASDYRAVPLLESARLAAWSNGAAFDPYEGPSSQVIVYLPELGFRAKCPFGKHA